MRIADERGMAALGERFRAAREARGLSQSDVAGQIHIRSVYLAAIEGEEWDTIGAPVYVRGFLRTYARFLGLDPEAAVQEFNESGAAAPPPVNPAVTSVGSANRTGTMAAPDRARPPVWGLIATVVAVLLVAFVGYEYWQYQSGQNADGAPVAAASKPPAAAPSAGEGASAAAASVAPAPAVRPTAAPVNQLAVRLTDASWLRVVVDGSVAMEGTFPKGTVRTFHGRAATLRIGNAGGVRVAVDGRDLGPMGHSGDVVERAFSLGG